MLGIRITGVGVSGFLAIWVVALLAEACLEEAEMDKEGECLHVADAGPGDRQTRTHKR